MHPYSTCCISRSSLTASKAETDPKSVFVPLVFLLQPPTTTSYLFCWLHTASMDVRLLLADGESLERELRSRPASPLCSLPPGGASCFQPSSPLAFLPGSPNDCLLPPPASHAVRPLPTSLSNLLQNWDEPEPVLDPMLLQVQPQPAAQASDSVVLMAPSPLNPQTQQQQGMCWYLHWVSSFPCANACFRCFYPAKAHPTASCKTCSR